MLNTCSTHVKQVVKTKLNINTDRQTDKQLLIPNQVAGCNRGVVENSVENSDLTGPITDYSSLGLLLTSRQLHGISYRSAECYGKPHINARYTADNVDAYTFDHDAKCLMGCGRHASNAHHVPPKSASRTFLLKTPIGTHVLKPALFALCGSGTTGCHGMFHARKVAVEWRWKTYEAFCAWWDGTILKYLPPHDEALYRYGYWHFFYRQTGAGFDFCG